ncbi:ABC transporter permease [Actinocatenispora thailandica]|uniref:ABC transporter permease n=1 Tax=Actinocatenispora thailandica TaxID=227318 RepID=A0A7R7DPH3_9ACTN|nr:ABC transporter permease [Actinocatenispora thailandica]BCJ35351.1 ABC transporter permease [Actinocatenispora thailandica]
MATTAVPARAAARPAPLLRGFRFELVKLLSQWRIRLLVLACWIVPAVFVAAVGQQSALPSDTLFGRSMHATGWAGSLVVLGFSGTWALPLLTALVAGDVFAVEDRLGTWRHLLVTVRSPRRIFAAKSLASLVVLLMMVVGLAASGIAGGLLAAGDRPLLGLDGHQLGRADAATTVLLAWLCVLAPTLAFAAVGLLGSIALGRSPMGLLMPALLALALQLVQLLPLPVAVRFALPSYTFLAWRGLFVQPAPVAPLVIGIVASLAWALAAAALAYRLFLRRDFTDLAYDGSGRRVLLAGLLPLMALLGLSVGTIAAGTGATGSGIDRAKLQGSLATTYAHLYVVQFRELGRPAVTEAQIRATASCDKGGSRVVDEGPGNDWRCVVTWHLPGVKAVGTATYQLDVTADGRYVADGDGPKSVNGYFPVPTPTGDAPNPLWQFDGTVDLLPSPPKG